MGAYGETDFLITQGCKFSKTALAKIGRPILYLWTS
jgi:hypothetical protein